MTEGLSIGDVAERTGLAAGTIRMWEQRYGAPTPRRLPSGYRVYGVGDVDPVSYTHLTLPTTPYV